MCSVGVGVVLCYFTNDFIVQRGRNIENLVMHSVLSFIGKVDVSPNTYLLHQELLNFMLVAMSTQLLSGPSPGPKDIHPFIDMAMVQESSFVGLVVRKLLLNYIMRPHFALNTASYDMFSEGNQSGVLQRVGSATDPLLETLWNILSCASYSLLRSIFMLSYTGVLSFWLCPQDCNF
ncbi:uncharacterized protein LOC114303635 isoform X2 [Camellia sinensis]|uniref:uncharacterized protein LOC114303635 isoform X2 n=1 Tax=Camellia sinensis TaxID=4442 RepID=UPI001035F7F6|nr:uncharacterized protein LOC114303635 isoform X2 [Camellia sinensis]